MADDNAGGMRLKSQRSGQKSAPKKSQRSRPRTTSFRRFNPNTSLIKPRPKRTSTPLPTVGSSSFCVTVDLSLLAT